MIYYFSSTGNSRYVAESLGEILDYNVKNIEDTEFRCTDTVSDSMVVVCPVYSWGIPAPVLGFIDTMDSSVCPRYCAVVLTCGDDTGRAPEMMEAALLSRGIRMNAVWSVQMPNTYVILPGFDIDSKETELSKLTTAAERVREIADRISHEESAHDVVAGSFPALKTDIIYPLFRRWGINGKKFHATDSCSGCGLCASRCPMHNIVMHEEDGKLKRPGWGKKCVSCLRCYHICPRHSVQYGQRTRRKGQYFLHDYKSEMENLS